MKKIAVLSDTHGMLRQEVFAELGAADVILHAGDVDTPAVMTALEACGEAHTVRGNNDGEWAQSLPESLRVTIEGVRFFLVHKKRDVPKKLTDVDVILYGHSHKYAAEVVEGVLWLNPGSCGRRRFHLEITMCRMTVNAGRYTFEKVTIAHEPTPKAKESRS